MNYFGQYYLQIYIFTPSQDYENELNNNDHVNKEYLITGRLIDVKLDDGNFIHEFYLENNNESTFGNQQQQQHSNYSWIYGSYGIFY